jgi:hypothetical protein
MTKPNLRDRSLREVILLVALVGSVAIQGYRAYEAQLRPTMEVVQSLMGLPAWQRAAIILEGEEFAGYLEFLRTEIPDDARVILPPRVPFRPVAHVGFMQYFLYPREIHNCGVNEVDACVLRVGGRTTYIVAVSDFPPPEHAQVTKCFVEFDEAFGVWVPNQTFSGDCENLH